MHPISRHRKSIISLKSIILVKILPIRYFLNEWNRLCRFEISLQRFLVIFGSYCIMYCTRFLLFFNEKERKIQFHISGVLLSTKLLILTAPERNVGLDAEMSVVPLTHQKPHFSWPFNIESRYREIIVPRGSIQIVVSDFWKWKIQVRKIYFNAFKGLNNILPTCLSSTMKGQDVRYSKRTIKILVRASILIKCIPKRVLSTFLVTRHPGEIPALFEMLSVQENRIRMCRVKGNYNHR